MTRAGARLQDLAREIGGRPDRVGRRSGDVGRGRDGNRVGWRRASGTRGDRQHCRQHPDDYSIIRTLHDRSVSLAGAAGRGRFADRSRNGRARRTARSAWRGGRSWRDARQWFTGSSWRELGLAPTTDAAGNSWVTLPGESTETVIIGGHLDSVPNGGWLDGALGVMAGLDALRMFKRPEAVAGHDRGRGLGRRRRRAIRPQPARIVGRQRQPRRRRRARPRRQAGHALPDALRENGVDLDRMLDAHAALEEDPGAGVSRAAHRAGTGARVDEQADRRRARHLRRRTPHAALHRPGRALGIDADPDAARCVPRRGGDARSRAARSRAATPRPTARVVCTVGTVKVEPGIVTAVPGVCEISLDQRALDAGVLAKMLADAKAASERAAARQQRHASSGARSGASIRGRSIRS